MSLPQKSTVRVAVVQASSVVLDKEKCVDKLEQLVKEAAGKGAELVLFPEAFISCYPRGTNFGVICGRRTPEGREKFRLYVESSVEVPGPTVDRLSAIAKESRVHLVVGVIERDGGTLYCTVLFFGDDGKYLGKHRKLVPTASERIFWGAGDGSTLPVFSTSLGKIGAVICWENYMPLLRVTLYSKGIQIYCAPTADARDQWTATMKHIAMEGRCFVLGCNQFNKYSDFPKGFIDQSESSSDENAVFCRGGSLIVNPLGEIIAGPHFDGETILYADLDMDDIPRAKLDFDAVGHYARPDVFTLHVNEGENRTVVHHTQPRQPEGHGHCHARVHQQHQHTPNCARSNVRLNNNED